MKKLFIIAAAACVTLASCVKNEPVQTPEFGDEISFESPILAPNTKVAEMTEFEGKSFDVWAHFTQNAWDASTTIEGATLYIDGVEMSDQGSSWYNTTNKSYWPKNGKLHFSAVYPANLSNVSIAATGVTISSYTVSTNVGDQEDLLISKRIYDAVKTGDPVASVPLVFDHALSAINFKAKAAAGTPITINSITISGVKGSGRFDQSLAPEKDSNWANEKTFANWTPSGDNVSYTAFTGALALTESPVFVSTGTDNRGNQADLILMPQDLETTGQTVTVTYTLDGMAGQTAKFELTGAWYRGVRYNYLLSFEAGDLITFTPTTTPWGSTDPVDTPL